MARTRIPMRSPEAVPARAPIPSPGPRPPARPPSLTEPRTGGSGDVTFDLPSQGRARSGSPSSALLLAKRAGRRAVFLAAVTGIATSSGTARASLGGSAPSVAADAAALLASGPSIDARAGYAVHTLQARSVTVREYLSGSVAVFAVAWNGRNNPDLSSLLGSHFAEYAKALPSAKRTPGRRYRQVRTDELVVETWGHMRNVQGRAWVPALLPPGVTPDVIR